MNSTEKANGEPTILEVDEDRSEIEVRADKKAAIPFTFDQVFGFETQQGPFFEVRLPRKMCQCSVNP